MVPRVHWHSVLHRNSGKRGGLCPLQRRASPYHPHQSILARLRYVPPGRLLCLPQHPYQIAFCPQIHQGVPFSTPSGKIEIYSSRLFQRHQPDLPGIPRYTPCEEGAQDPLRAQFPLLLIGFHTNRRCHSIHDNNPQLDELESPRIWIHPDDADARGIRDGDLVEIFNRRGRVRIPAKVTRRIVPGCVAMSEGGWYTPDQQGVDTRGSINVLTMTHRATPLAKANPQHTNLVEVCLFRKSQIDQEV